jgi:hypothetical protein
MQSDSTGVIAANTFNKHEISLESLGHEHQVLLGHSISPDPAHPSSAMQGFHLSLVSL